VLEPDRVVACVRLDWIYTHSVYTMVLKRSANMILQATYSINATSQSPQSASPTLTQSTSASNSNFTPSTSPINPKTPPRYSRSKTRYPDLGRVPLHRRGTSKTYEHLEDLLREAGYKDTRIFTPEGEHGDEAVDECRGLKSDTDKRGSIRGGVNAVVGFLSGLMPGGAVSRSSSLERQDSYGIHPTGSSSHSLRGPYSPQSPLAHKRAKKQQPRTPLSSEPHSPITTTSSIESLEHTPRARHRSPPRSITPVLPNIAHSQSQQTHAYQRPRHQLVHRISDQSTYSLRRPLLHPQTSRTSLRQHGLTSPSGMANVAQPRPSRAGAYLRHMTSQPDIPKRPNSTPAHLARRTFLLNNSELDISNPAFNENCAVQEQPPLPRTWIESVARAVLFGGVGAYVGGPSGPPSISEPETESLATHGKTLRSTRSSISQVSPNYSRFQQSRSGLSDRTNTRSASLLAPPELFTQIDGGDPG
jgi:hypothetical protein